MNGAVWVYAVVPEPAGDSGAGAGPLAGDTTGVAGESVRLVGQGGLAAATGSVPLSDFAEQPLKDHLEDLRWLEAAARAHHQVIEELHRATDVVPLQFATVYHDDDAVRAVLADRAGDFAAAFARTRGRDEWGVKAYVDPDAPAPAAEPEASGGGTPGTAYLLRRKAEQRSREDAYRRAEKRAEQLRAALADTAEQEVAHRPQDQRLAGYEGWMILNDSFLVPRAGAEDFAASVSACREQFPDVRLEVSGPWPPYSFVGREEQP